MKKITASQTGLSVRLFGVLSISLNQKAVDTIRKESQRSLLAYLILKAQTPQTRSHIASHFWPDMSDTEAKTRLRRELYQLKQLLPAADKILKVTASTLHWQPQIPAWVDVMVFEQAIADAAEHSANPSEQVDYLKQAVELYQGTLLSDCYDEWIVTERDRLHQLVLDALTDLTLLLTQLGAYRDAITYCQKLLQIDPLIESGYLALMKLYVQQGDRATALQKYHQCMMVLREELGVDPSPETRQFYEQLISEETIPTTLPTSPSTQNIQSPIASSPSTQIDWGEAPDIQFFHGRSEELHLLKTWIVDDQTRLIAVLGLGGMGKTTLTAKVVQELQQEFELIIWRSLRNAPPLDSLLRELILFLSHQQDTGCSINRLMHWLRQSRCLVILDNLETILQEGERAGQFRAETEGYRELIQVVCQSNHQSCVILTSREKPAEIATFEGMNHSLKSLQLSGSSEASFALLDAKQLTGTHDEKAQLCERYSYSPLALQIVGGSIRDIFDGDISLFLEEDTLLFNGAKKLLDQQFERLIALEKTVMVWLAIHRDWTSITDLMSDIYPRCSKSKLLEALESLSWRSLIERRGNTYTQQPVVMEYVTLRLIEQVSTEYIDWTSDTPSQVLHLTQYALIQVQAKTYLREAQIRLILQPIAQEIQQSFPTISEIERQCRDILQGLRDNSPERSGYCSGNLINLLRALNVDLNGYDFSQLPVWQANLQGIALHNVDFSNANLSNSCFNQTFSSITGLTFSPDGQILASGDMSGTVRLWNLEGQAIKTLPGHLAWVFGLAFSPDGEYLVSSSFDSTVRLWNVASGKCLKVFLGHQDFVVNVAFSPDGKRIASGSDDQTVKIWDITTGTCQKTLQGHEGWVRSVVFAPKGNQLITSGNDQTIRIWDLDSGEILQTLQGHTAPIWSVAVSADGKYLASASHDHTLKLWDRDKGQCLKTFQGHTSEIWLVRFSLSGKQLISGSIDHTLRFWDIQTGQCSQTLQGHRDQVWAIAQHPTEPIIASGGLDQTVRLWDSDSGQCLQTWQGYANRLYSLAFTNTGDHIITGSEDGLVRIWDWQEGRLETELEGHQTGVWGVTIHPEKQLLATGDFNHSIRIWDLDTQTCLCECQGDTTMIYSLAFHPDGERLASSGLYPTIFLWDRRTGQCIREFQGHQDSIWAVAYSPDGTQMISSSADQTLKIWDIASGDCLQTLHGHRDRLSGVTTFRPQPRHSTRSTQKYFIATTGADRLIKVWDSHTGNCLQTLEGHTSWGYAVVAHPDGASLASASHDGTVCLWDLETGECFGILNHGFPVWSVVYHPQGNRVASCGFNDILSIWDIQTQELDCQIALAKPYKDMNISGVTGLTEMQTQMLLSLGALS